MKVPEFTHKTVDQWFKNNSNAFIYTSKSGYELQVSREKITSKWVYSAILLDGLCTVWACGSYTTTENLVNDVMKHGLVAFNRHIED